VHGCPSPLPACAFVFFTLVDCCDYFSAVIALFSPSCTIGFFPCSLLALHSFFLSYCLFFPNHTNAMMQLSGSHSWEVFLMLLSVDCFYFLLPGCTFCFCCFSCHSIVQHSFFLSFLFTTAPMPPCHYPEVTIWQSLSRSHSPELSFLIVLNITPTLQCHFPEMGNCGCQLANWWHCTARDAIIIPEKATIKWCGRR